MENKKPECPEVPEELELKAGILANSLLKLPPKSRKEIEKEWRRKRDGEGA